MKLFRLLLLVALSATSLAAQQVCPCVPTTPLWTVKTCDSWDCAMAALTTANGDPLTFTLPVSTTERRWVVIQRVVAGAYVEDSGEPHQVEVFDGVAVATARVSAIADDHHPMILSAPDGHVLVVSLKQAAQRRRSAGH